MDIKKYRALHHKIKRLKAKPILCEKCKKNKATELSNISGNYLDNVNDFWWLCGNCHSIYDNKAKNLEEWNKTNKRKSFVERFGKEKAKMISEKIRKSKLGKKWTEKQKESIKGIKKPYLSERNRKNKGKSYEEIYGKEKAKQIKLKMKLKTQKRKRNTKGKFK